MSSGDFSVGPPETGDGRRFAKALTATAMAAVVRVTITASRASSARTD
jgi:hypothetical protein